MKKTLKIISFVILTIVILFTALILILNTTTFNVKFDENKLINSRRTIVFYDNNERVFAEQSKGLNITTIDDIPSHTINAFIAIEDKRFYTHNGVDYKALLRATLNNLKSGSIKEGASTITQQLIKNTHLTNEKTLKRKITEIKLAKQLEKKYNKNQILETYLNTIYFGDNCYGITSAALHYFNKKPRELNINESAVLAAIVKAPAYYSPFNDLERSVKRKNLVLSEMFNQKFITKEVYEENKNKQLILSNATTNEYDYLYLVNKEISSLISKNPYGFTPLNIHTSFDANLQSALNQTFTEFVKNKCEMSAIIMDKNASVLAYYSTYGDNKRQIGSIIKPIGVYAPVIEENIVNSCTFICDKKEDFNGYSPSNYNDVYRNDISVKDSLCYSSNVCAVKLLNSLGVNKSMQYLNKLGISLSENDKNLSLGLGASEKGAKLSEVVAAYCPFINKGYYTNPKCTKNLIKTVNRKVFGEDTAYVVSDMLSGVVKYGTAKKLQFINDKLCAKTGTVGSKSGNTDAYTVSFSKDYVLGVWCGAKDGALIPNSISGGTLPAKISAEIWKKIENEKGKQTSIDMPNSVSEIEIDKNVYEKYHKIILSDDNAPSRYKLKFFFKNNNIPKEKSNVFSKPKIESYKTSVVNNGIKIELCVTELFGAKLYKIVDGKKELIFDTKDGNIYIDKQLKQNDINQYIIIPYYKTENEIFYGDEVVLEKIKTPNFEFGDDWWDYD